MYTTVIAPANCEVSIEKCRTRNSTCAEGDAFEKRVPLGEFGKRRARMREWDRKPLEPSDWPVIHNVFIVIRGRAQPNGLGLDEEDSGGSENYKATLAGLHRFMYTYYSTRKLDSY